MRRVPYYGASNTLLGQESIESSIGPLGRTLSGCVSLFKAIVDGQPWDFDTKVVEIKWRKEMLQLTEKGGPDAKMCFGFYDDDGYVKCLPPIQRAIKETVDALRAAGHTGMLSSLFCCCLIRCSSVGHVLTMISYSLEAT